MSQGPYLVANHPSSVLRLLVVCRETSILGPLWAIGEANRWQLESATSGWGAMERVQFGITPDLLILDVPRDDSDGLHFLRWLRRLRPELPILVLHDSEDATTRKEATRLGARECIEKPAPDHALEKAIRRQSAVQAAEDAADSGLDVTSDDVVEIGDGRLFIAASPAMRRVRAQIELLAETDSPILILGEGGSGKETIARLLHQSSLRSAFRFAKISCAALPSDLLEIELFGSEGNGSRGVQRGKLELCNRGTLLLDEIAEMPMGLQSKLLQVLQTQRFVRPGNGASVPVDVRILAASSAPFESAIEDGKLREDLCYWLNTYTVRVPPLRDRRSELPLLVHYLMRDLARHYALPLRPLSPAVLEACQVHKWPGNLRELEGFVKRLLLAPGEEMPHAIPSDTRSPAYGSTVLPVEVLAPGGGAMGDVTANSGSLKSLVQTVKLEAERNAISAALERTGWNRKAASRLLKISYRTLLYKIEQYQMRAPRSSVVPGSAGTKPN